MEEQGATQLAHRGAEELGEVSVRQLAHPVGDHVPIAALCRRLNSGSVSGVNVVHGLGGDGFTDRLVLARPERRHDREAGWPGGPVDGRSHRVLDHLAGPIRARTAKELVADVPEGDDVLGDDLAIDPRYLGRRLMNRPWSLSGPSFRGSTGSKIIQSATQLRRIR